MKVPVAVAAAFAPLFGIAVVLGLSGDPVRLLQEGGFWMPVLILLTLATGVAPPLLAAFTKLPRAIWGALALLPLAFGALAVVVTTGNVAEAIVSVSAADKMTIAAVGSAEIASILSLALVCGGLAVAGVGAVVAVVERGPAGALMLAVGLGSAVLGLRWLELRTFLTLLYDVSAADKSFVLAAALASAQVYAVVLVVLAVLGLVGGLVLGMMPKAGAEGVVVNVGVCVVSVVAVACAFFGDRALTGLTGSMPPAFPVDVSTLLEVPGEHDDVAGNLLKKGGAVEEFPFGASSAYALSVDVTVADLRALAKQRAAQRQKPTKEQEEQDRDRMRIFGDREAELKLVGPRGGARSIPMLTPDVLRPLLAPLSRGLRVTPLDSFDPFSFEAPPIVVVTKRTDLNLVFPTVADAKALPEDLPAGRGFLVIIDDDVGTTAMLGVLAELQRRSDERDRLPILWWPITIPELLALKRE